MGHSQRMMPGFERWCEWAATQSDTTWYWVAENAKADASYDDPAAHQAYKEKLGAAEPDNISAFRLCCVPYQLAGTPITEALPPYLTRSVTLESVHRYVEQALEEGGASMDLRRAGAEDFSPRINVARETWKALRDCVLLDDEMYELGIRLSYHLSKSVFATFTESDQEPPDLEHEPGFWLAVQQHPGYGRTPADEVVYRLALTNNPGDRAARDQVLLYYDARNMAPFCYPVPPDAGFFSRFRPVAPGSGFAYGRTCPGPRDTCDEDLAHDEIVHANHPLAYDDIWIIGLGETSSYPG